MNLIQILLGAGALLTAITSGVWFWLASRQGEGKKTDHSKKQARDTAKKHAAQSAGGGNVNEAVQYDVEHVFNNEFREELRNRGRLYFEKIINENAMFLQQDLRLTTSQLNDYMKNEIKRVLQEEFGKYEESITGANELAVSSIQKTQAAIEQQRELLQTQLIDEVAKEKDLILRRFSEDMAEIVNHYILSAIGNELDMNDQVGFIIRNLEENKQAIIEDISHGA